MALNKAGRVGLDKGTEERKVKAFFDLAGFNRGKNKEAAREKYTRPQVEPGLHPRGGDLAEEPCVRLERCPVGPSLLVLF